MLSSGKDTLKRFLMLRGQHAMNTYAVFLNKESCCYCSVVQSCQTLCDPMDCSTPGFPILHYLPESAQTHVHWVGDAIQSSHSLSSPSLFLSLSQYQGLFQWVYSSYQVALCIVSSASASVLPMNIQGWFYLGLIGLISLLSKGLSRVHHHNSKASVL